VHSSSSTAARTCAAVAALLTLAGSALWDARACADDVPSDARIRVVPYAADEVYRLKGYVGYQIDLEFEPGETFLGLGSGDLGSLAYAAQDNHLFLKPKAGGIETNLTVLTTRRAYHFDYAAAEERPDPAFGNVIYVLRFVYAPQPRERAQQVEQRLASASETRWHNLNYYYRGSPELKPQSAWDDGVQTRLSFGAQQELPAVFVRNDDGSESLVNFTVDAGALVVHRVAREFSVRRGRLVGCIVNEGFTGTGERLESGTVAPAVERVTRGVQR
jgi:type IV secretion system protein VirB9